MVHRTAGGPIVLERWWPRIAGVALAVLTASTVLVSCGAAEESETPGASGAPAPEAVSGSPDTTGPLAGTSVIGPYAGTGSPRFGGDGGPASSAGFFGPLGVALDDDGNLYISTDNRVRKVEAATGIISTIAGTGRNRHNGDYGPAVEAALAEPKGIAVDGAGNLFIAENGSGRIRMVDASTGIITTFAGGGVGNPLLKEFGDGGPATEALIKLPEDVAVDGGANLYIVTVNRIRMVDAETGVISTVAGTGERGVEGDGGPATEATLAEPVALAVDREGNIYIADRDNHRVRRVDAATGIMTTLAGIGKFHIRDPLYYRGEASYDLSLTAATGAGYSGDGGPADEAMLSVPSSVALDPQGNVFVADGGIRVRKVDAATGFISTVAGGETQTSYETGKIQVHTGLIGRIASIAVNAQGEAFLADFKNNVIHKASVETGAP